MKKTSFMAGTSINEACDRAYNYAIHGESLYFDFNGVRITMRPKSQLDDDLAMATNSELSLRQKIRYLLFADDTVTHVIETTECDGVTFLFDDYDDSNQYEVTIKKVEQQ